MSPLWQDMYLFLLKGAASAAGRRAASGDLLSHRFLFTAFCFVYYHLSHIPF